MWLCLFVYKARLAYLNQTNNILFILDGDMFRLNTKMKSNVKVMGVSTNKAIINKEVIYLKQIGTKKN